MKRKPGIVKSFELTMTVAQLKEAEKHFSPDLRWCNHYMLAIQPVPCLQKLKVCIISKQFGNKLDRHITAERKRSGV